jgi:hypothetical protein
MTATSDVARKPDITNKCRNDADDPDQTCNNLSRVVQ